MFYSSPSNLIAPGRARVMGEGWETSRRRDQGNDLVELDTSYFLGNAPGWASVQGHDSGCGTSTEILPRQRLQPDTPHRFLVPVGPEITHARLDVYPDGGMARMRLWGEPSAQGREDLALRWFNALPDAQVRALVRPDHGDHPAAGAGGGPPVRAPGAT